MFWRPVLRTFGSKDANGVRRIFQEGHAEVDRDVLVCRRVVVLCRTLSYYRQIDLYCLEISHYDVVDFVSLLLLLKGKLDALFTLIFKYIYIIKVM